MAQQTIGVGTSANDGTGDPLRTGGTKINANFTELYGRTVAASETASGIAELATQGEVNVGTDAVRIVTPATLRGYFTGAGTINLYTDFTQTGNVGTGEDTLMTYSVPAATLAGGGQIISGSYAGTFAASINNKRLRLKFGATTIFDTGVLAITAATDWIINFQVMGTGAATQKCWVSMNTSSATLAAYADYATAGETLSGAINLVLTGEATANNDIVKEMFKVKFEA